MCVEGFEKSQLYKDICEAVQQELSKEVELIGDEATYPGVREHFLEPRLSGWYFHPNRIYLAREIACDMFAAATVRDICQDMWKIDETIVGEGVLLAISYLGVMRWIGRAARKASEVQPIERMFRDWNMDGLMKNLRMVSSEGLADLLSIEYREKKVRKDSCEASRRTGETGEERVRVHLSETAISFMERIRVPVIEALVSWPYGPEFIRPINVNWDDTEELIMDIMGLSGWGLEDHQEWGEVSERYNRYLMKRGRIPGTVSGIWREV